MSRRVSAKPGSSPRGGDRTRRRILGAALRLFSRNGFHGTSIRGLAGSVGLTEAAIYYHFPSKRAIVKALYEQRGFMTALDELEHLPGEIPLDQQLVANAVASARLWDENSDLLRVVIVEVLRGDGAAQAVHQELMDKWRKGILDLLARYQAKRELDVAIDPVDAANQWVDLMFGVFMDRLLALGRSSRRSDFLAPEFRRHVETTAVAFAGRLRGAAAVNSGQSAGG
jgi:AcrR family transcriptional regulator